jgi:hypothetical protein
VAFRLFEDVIRLSLSFQPGRHDLLASLRPVSRRIHRLGNRRPKALFSLHSIWHGI